MDYKKLKPGTREVRVSVTDGTVTMEEDITLVFRKAEDATVAGAMWCIIALSVAVLINRRRFR